jgi:hypothetical protein
VLKPSGSGDLSDFRLLSKHQNKMARFPRPGQGSFI